MADFSKYSSYSIGRLFLHNNRMVDDGVKHSNESIDNERTMYNYHIKKGTAKDVQERISELFLLHRSDSTVVGEMVVTLPKNVKPEDERDFFQAVYDFYSNDFGEENIVNAVVHKDEKQPHIHLDFIPVLEGEPQYKSKSGINALEEWKKTHDGETPKQRICCKDLINRAYLSKMHTRLSEYVKSYLGYEAEIINGATINGNRTVLQLKNDTLKKDIDKLEKQQKHLADEIHSIVSVAKQHGVGEHDIGLYPLLQKIADLENRNAVLKNIIMRQGYSYKKEDLEAIKAKEYISASSAFVNVYEGSLVDANIEKNAVVIIELPDQIARPLPQQKLISKDPDLERQTRFIQTSTKAVMCRQSRMTDRIYVFIKTDSTKQTMENLLLMERQLRELDLTNRKVYMDRMETDTYDLARSILYKDQIETMYYENSSIAEKNKENEPTIAKEIN